MMWGFSFYTNRAFYILRKAVMIYLNNISKPQVIFVPKSRETKGDMVFSIKSTINLDVPVDAKVADIQSDFFVQFPVTLPADITSGEYEYILTDAEGVVSTGLLCIEGESGMQEFNKSITYEQFK